MRRLIMTAIAALALAGCTTLPTIEQAATMSLAVGASVAKVACIYDDKIPVESRNATVEVVSKLQYCVPGTNETFKTAWTGIASKHLDKLVADGTITALQKTKIMVTVSMATSAIDRYCDKHENVKQSKEYMSAIVQGFCTGFLDNFRPANGFSAAAAEYDEDTYDFLMQTYCK